MVFYVIVQKLKPRTEVRGVTYQKTAMITSNFHFLFYQSTISATLKLTPLIVWKPVPVAVRSKA
jgi:hypothetical protein